jgi:hypothetical protein
MQNISNGVYNQPVKKWLLLSIAVCLFSCSSPEVLLDGTHSVYGDTGIAAGMSFPPFANSKQIEFTVAELDKLSIDRIRIAIDWRNREPERGEFYWAPMDDRMKAAAENEISVFLTIASVCPDWAKLPPGSDGANRMDEEALETFIEAVLLRYDNIDKIQFGNEWETGAGDGTAYISPASVEKFVLYTNILYDAVQRLSPETQVVLGGLTRTYPMVEYFMKNGAYPDFSGITLSRGVSMEDLEARMDRLQAEYVENGIQENIEYVFANASYDILDIHLYDDPENWPEYLSVLPDDRPILVSEFGGPNSEFEETSAAYQAERMEDYMDAIEQLPIIEAYYFKLVDSKASYHQDSGLYYGSLRPKPARNVFAERLTPLGPGIQVPGAPDGNTP